MPPKVKITKEDIISTALDLIRRGGDGQINARAVASALGCSTQPIFSNFKSMEELEEATIIAAYNIYIDFIDEWVNDADAFFPKDVLLKLKITTDNIAENEYVQFKTKHSLPKISFGKIEYSYDITAQVLDWDSWEVLREYSGHKTVAFAFDFATFRWRIESVQ